MDILAPDEKLIKKIHPSRWYFWYFYLAGLFFLAMAAGFSFFTPLTETAIKNIQIHQMTGWINFLLLVLGFGMMALVELLRIIRTYYISDKRIIEEFRFLSRRLTSTYYSQIQNINSVQGITERVVGIGNLEFHTAGWGESNRPEICFRGVKEPVFLKNTVIEVKIKLSAAE